MRSTWMAVIPALASVISSPAAGQVSARVHIDIPIGRPGPVIYSAPHRQLVVREYDQNRFGDWDEYYDQWSPVTVYYYDGYYYDYPVVPYAEPLLVYRFRDEIFFAPRQREFITWQRQYRIRDNRRDDRQYQAPRDDRQYQAPRDDRQYQAPRDDRRYQAPRNDRNWGDARRGHDAQPVQPQRNDHNVQPAPARGAYRSRPRP